MRMVKNLQSSQRATVYGKFSGTNESRTAGFRMGSGLFEATEARRHEGCEPYRKLHTGADHFSLGSACLEAVRMVKNLQSSQRATVNGNFSGTKESHTTGFRMRSGFFEATEARRHEGYEPHRKLQIGAHHISLGSESSGGRSKTCGQ